MAERCRQRWLADANRHTSPVPHARALPTDGLPLLPPAWVSLPWEGLVGQRAVARVRADYLRTVHMNGRRSSAAVQRCVLCNDIVFRGCAHAILRCPALGAARVALAGVVDWVLTPGPSSDVLCRLLRLLPEDSSYVGFVALVAELDSRVARFWFGHDGVD